MDHLDQLESISIYILREAYANFKSLGMLWSIGKDSTVLLWLTRKAFFGHVPLPLIHIDTTYKIPEMTAYRDRLTEQWRLKMIYGINEEGLEEQTDLSRRQGRPDHLLPDAEDGGLEEHLERERASLRLQSREGDLRAR